MPHVERRPREPPLPCFGLELDSSDPKCAGCPYRSDCTDASGARAGKVPLERAAYKLAHHGLRAPAAAPHDVAAIYSLAHLRVFGSEARDAPSAVDCATAREKAADHAMPVESFVYACLLGHKVSCPERRPSARLLSSPSADRRAAFYRGQAAKAFGTVDVHSVSSVTSNPDSLHEALLASEELFGAWIIGARVSRGGNGVGALYSNRETALSPYWLATEPTYLKWMAEQPARQATARAVRGGRDCVVPDEIHRLRSEVGRVPEGAALDLLRLRAIALPLAVSSVLRKHGVAPSALLVESPVRGAFKLWLGIGDALLQLRLLSDIDR